MLQIYTSKVPRKGKGAKGFNVVESFGKPILNTEGVAESFDYSHLKDFKWQEILDFVESTRRFTNRAMVESAVRGFDNTLRSVTVREEIATTELSEWILEQDLAEDEKSSRELASLWFQTQDFQKKCNVLVNSKEDFAVGRKVYVDGLKAAGVWKVKLVVNPETPAVAAPVVPTT